MTPDPSHTKLTDWPFRRLTRVVIEFSTPFHVGAGRGGSGIDALVVTDANGLPTIPGSSLAGALKAAMAAMNPDLDESFFGYQRASEGIGSRLSVSWACIHDSTDTPVEGVAMPTRLDDPVLAQALVPRLRDHVRLHHQGAQETHGKFDEWPVCAGHRFTFELELVSQDSAADDAAWRQLLQVLGEGSLRLGGKTRRGFGCCHVVARRDDCYDLRQTVDFADYLARPVSLADRLLRPDGGDCFRGTTALTATLRLTPEGYWMFGGGDDPEGAAKSGKAPVRDDRIVWGNNVGAVERDVLVLPGSAIKGALSHRVAWHCNRQSQRWADSGPPPPIGSFEAWRNARDELSRQTGENNPAVREFFGYRKSQTDGQPGRVLIDDVFVSTIPQDPQRDQLAPHVAIDRVTGGAIESRLFADRPLWQAPHSLVITLALLDEEGVSPESRRALEATLSDLCQGRLALGAGGGRGMGFCTGSVEWSDGGKWTKEVSP